MTLAGFKSRWMTPFLCAYAIASHTLRITPSARVSFQPSCSSNTRSKIFLRSRPFTSFIVKKTRPSLSSPSSWTGTMPG